VQIVRRSVLCLESFLLVLLRGLKMSKMLPTGLIALLLAVDVSYFAQAQLGDPGGGGPETPPCDYGCFEAVWKWSGSGTQAQRYYHEAGQGMVLFAPNVSGAVYCYDEPETLIDYHKNCLAGPTTCFTRRDNGEKIFGFEAQVTGAGQCQNIIHQLVYCDCSGEES
jgi:hypothetical protein